jgi:hypothetical protein
MRVIHRKILPKLATSYIWNSTVLNIFLYFWLHTWTMYWNMVILFKFWSNCVYEDLKKALDLSTFTFLISFWLFIANKKKARKDKLKWVYIICVRKTQNWRTVSFGVFQKHEWNSSFYERSGKESTVRKTVFFIFSKKLKTKVLYQNRFFDFFHPHWVSVYPRLIIGRYL